MPSLSSTLQRWGRTRVRDLRGSFAPRPRNRDVSGVPADFPPGVVCLVGTKRGLFRVGEGRVRLLLDGEFYGVTGEGERWLAYEKLGTRGRVLGLHLAGAELAGARTLAAGLSPGCHQIDRVGDALLVADTYRNGILVLAERGGRLERTGEHRPFGDLDRGRASEAYVHLNSLWRDEAGLHVVLHNETKKTGRPSEVALLDDDFRVVRRVPAGAANAHNVVRVGGEYLVCDSGGGALVLGGRPVFRAGLFTRGLALTGDHVLVGGSEYGERERRDRLAGALFVLDRDYRLRTTLPLPGMVQEVRAVGVPDRGLSRWTDTQARSPG